MDMMEIDAEYSYEKLKELLEKERDFAESVQKESSAPKNMKRDLTPEEWEEAYKMGALFNESEMIKRVRERRAEVRKRIKLDLDKAQEGQER